MIVTLAEVMDEHFKKVKFDSKLTKQMYSYQIGYINSNREHLEFFGSNLLGTHVVRFKDKDVLKLYNDILDIDYLHLSRDLESVSAVNQDFKVSSDVFNLTTMYMIHRFLTSNIINDKLRYRGAYDTTLIFFYRCIAAILSYYFRYPADPKIAQATYANLSNKYLIKKVGSWHKVMDYRAEDLLKKESIHLNKLISFNDDNAIVYAINDSQGRIRDLVKNYYTEFKKVHDDGERIATSSNVLLNIEGEEATKEKTKSVESYISYAKSIIGDKHSFVKDDLVKVISKINNNSSFKMIKTTLSYMSDNYHDAKQSKVIDELLTTTISHSFYMLSDNVNALNLNDYPRILITLKNLHLSTRSSDSDLLRIREIGSAVVRNSSEDDLSESLVLATRTSILLYIMLRVLAGKK